MLLPLSCTPVVTSLRTLFQPLAALTEADLLSVTLNRIQTNTIYDFSNLKSPVLLSVLLEGPSGRYHRYSACMYPNDTGWPITIEKLLLLTPVWTYRGNCSLVTLHLVISSRSTPMRYTGSSEIMISLNMPAISFKSCGKIDTFILRH
jgi:hypothetical protein